MTDETKQDRTREKYQWFYERDGRKVGPFVAADLRRLYAAGIIVDGMTLLRSDGRKMIVGRQAASQSTATLNPSPPPLPPPPPDTFPSFPSNQAVLPRSSLLALFKQEIIHKLHWQRRRMPIAFNRFSLVGYIILVVTLGMLIRHMVGSGPPVELLSAFFALVMGIVSGSGVLFVCWLFAEERGELTATGPNTFHVVFDSTYDGTRVNLAGEGTLTLHSELLVLQGRIPRSGFLPSLNKRSDKLIPIPNVVYIAVSANTVAIQWAKRGKIPAHATLRMKTPEDAARFGTLLSQARARNSAVNGKSEYGDVPHREHKVFVDTLVDGTNYHLRGNGKMFLLKSGLILQARIPQTGFVLPILNKKAEKFLPFREIVNVAVSRCTLSFDIMHNGRLWSRTYLVARNRREATEIGGLLSATKTAEFLALGDCNWNLYRLLRRLFRG